MAHVDTDDHVASVVNDDTATPAPQPAERKPRPPRKRRRRRKSSESRFAWALIAPAATFMVLIHLIPTLGGLYVSLLRLNVFTLSKLFGAPNVGLQNYNNILFDSSNPLHSGFTNAVWNTVFYTSAVVIGTVGGGLVVALLLNRPFPGQRLVRTLMLTPWIVPTFVAATLWQFMFQKDAGIINQLLVDDLHILSHRPTWLLGSNTMWAIVIPSVWRGLPLPMLFFIAGLQAIPDELHEAAKMDGAGAFRRFREITLPLLRPLIGIQILFGVIYSTYQFTIPYVMLGSNPGKDADLLMTLIVRQSFDNSLFGYGAAISTLLMIGMAVWALIWYLAFRRDLEVAAA